ncbi:uncharacterized protein BXZ73DRAFT_77201 [Epithele typhae]|uniref:uncharacterized protein n=1 Tax=Epithele typhae TaxID=378194 RepID=UPI0020079FAE|nr:uncharacterized protein BXZ73DRAFT_77201 [Epithele typhae]KAH9933575.1 hypothetical protein BXZ73DRAFT_77201 [Epithele typhae]
MSASSNSTEAPQTAVPPPLPSLDNTLGALLLGTFFGLILYGVVIHQAYRYFRLFPQDGRLIRAFLMRQGSISSGCRTQVVAIMFLETVHTITCMHASYWYTVTNYFQPTALLFAPWSIQFLRATALSQYVKTLVEFSHSLISGVKLANGYVPSWLLRICLGFKVPTWERYAHYAWLDSAGFGITTFADFIITASLIYTLRQCRTGFSGLLLSTDSTLDTIIIYSINTGLITGIFNTISFIFALVSPNNMIYEGVIIIATKMYANSLFAVLNSRRSLPLAMRSKPLAGTTGAGAGGFIDIPTTHASADPDIELAPRGHSKAAGAYTDAELWDVPSDASGRAPSSTGSAPVLDVALDGAGLAQGQREKWAKESFGGAAAYAYRGSGPGPRAPSEHEYEYGYGLGCGKEEVDLERGWGVGAGMGGTDAQVLALVPNRAPPSPPQSQPRRASNGQGLKWARGV